MCGSACGVTCVSSVSCGASCVQGSSRLYFVAKCQSTVRLGHPAYPASIHGRPACSHLWFSKFAWWVFAFSGLRPRGGWLGQGGLCDRLISSRCPPRAAHAEGFQLVHVLGSTWPRPSCYSDHCSRPVGCEVASPVVLIPEASHSQWWFGPLGRPECHYGDPRCRSALRGLGHRPRWAPGSSSPQLCGPGQVPAAWSPGLR